MSAVLSNSLSVIVIGKNSSLTISECISCIKQSIKESGFFKTYEIVYVDSNSNDSSVFIAKEMGGPCIEIP